VRRLPVVDRLIQAQCGHLVSIIGHVRIIYRVVCKECKATGPPQLKMSGVRDKLKVEVFLDFFVHYSPAQPLRMERDVFQA